MSSPGRRLAMILPVAVTVLLAAVIGALVVVQGQQQKDEVEQADAAGETFLADVGTFRSKVAREIKGTGTADATELRRVVDAAISEPPRLHDASDHGKQESASYASAQQLESTFLEPYQQLSRTLRRTDVALTFIAAAKGVLKLRATDYVGFGPVGDSARVRSRLVPAFVAARDSFVAVRVPQGQESLAKKVRGAAQYVIDQATALAASIDANRSFSFGYADRFRAAAEAVDGYATTVKGDLAEALNAVA